MHNTRSNVSLQSMKTNPLSVKKLMKKLTLKALRQLYVVSEANFLIRWVTPPQKLKIFNLSFSLVFKIPQFLSNSSTCIDFTISVVCHPGRMAAPNQDPGSIEIALHGSSRTAVRSSFFFCRRRLIHSSRRSKVKKEKRKEEWITPAFWI